MNRRTYISTLALGLTFAGLGFLTSCSSSSSGTSSTALSISANTGYTASAGVGTSFGSLSATVTSGGAPAANVSVTFTAPATGASGVFTTSGAATETDMTNSSGVATSSAFTAGTVAGPYIVTAAASGSSTTASFNLTNTSGTAANMTTTASLTQTSYPNTAFPSLAVNVTDSDGNPVSGVSVTFTATVAGSGATGIFTSTMTGTETDTTDASGNATPSGFTANGILGGPYTVTATSGTLTPIVYTLTNIVAPSATYVFYLSGEEAINDGPNYYAVAGAVTIDALGNVLGGEEDYNDGFGNTSPGEPATADVITPSVTTTPALSVSATTGIGTLTLTSANTNTGVAGVQTFAVQFVNASHALITQFDGTATSSGSLDLQTSATAPTGAFSFVVSGVDNSYDPVAAGGVFGTGADVYDVNDNGSVSTNNALTMTLGATDAYGRGQTTNSIGVTLNYYVVGPEVMRLVDVGFTDSAVGSAFGQGTAAGTFSAASLGAAVFGLSGNSWSSLYGAAGLLTTDGSSAITGGVGDDNELLNDVQALAATIAAPTAGSYAIGSNGYGSVTIPSGQFGDVSQLGLYMTDPTLNLSDPNNVATGSSVGGGLLLDLDDSLAGGTGVVVPQTDAATAGTDFAGTYLAGWQDFNTFNNSCPYCEFDGVSNGSMASAGALALTGDDSDPFGTWDGTVGEFTGDTFAGTPVPDANAANAGRYTIAPMTVTVNGSAEGENVSIYQASGGQLFWVGTETTDVFFGSLEQQGSLTGLPSVRKGTGKPQAQPKR